jgi:hypothetical protein
MLSRENVIHRSAGEERLVGAKPVRADAGSDAFLKGRILAKLALLVLLTGLLGASLLLNRGSVVEPGVHLVFSSYQRPSLLVVMLLTSIVSAAGALLIRAAFATMRQLRDARSRTSLSPPPLKTSHTLEPALAGAGPVS